MLSNNTPLMISRSLSVRNSFSALLLEKYNSRKAVILLRNPSKLTKFENNYTKMGVCK